MRFASISREISLLAVGAAGLMLNGCSGGEDVTAAAAQVQEFHYMLDNQDYETLWTRSAPELRNAAPKAGFIKFLTAVHTKLGKVKASSQAGWNVNYNTGGTFTTVNYHTQFERGSGDESFVYKTVEGKAILAGYHVNSTDMMVN